MFVTVAGTPNNVISIRTGEYTVQLSWSVPASNTPPVEGYEVFYAESGSDVTQSEGTTTDTTMTLTLPAMSAMYDIFVVAFSNEADSLPSARSSNSTVDLSEFNHFNNKATFSNYKALMK